MEKLYKWSSKELLKFNDYKICECSSEDEAIQVKKLLKENGRCAQAGYHLSNDGKVRYFVITKEKKNNSVSVTA